MQNFRALFSMRVPKRPFVLQFKNEKWKATYMYPNGYLFFKLKIRIEKIILLSYKFIFKSKQQLKTSILQIIISFWYSQTYNII